jgi:hypothetical protein
VDGDCLGRAFTTLVDGSALREAPCERGYQNHVAASFLGLEHNGVRPHKGILSQGRPKLVGRNAGLRQDRSEKGWSDRLAGMQGHGHATTALWMPELGVGTSLSYHFPSEAPECRHDLSTGHAREWGHLPTVRLFLASVESPSMRVEPCRGTMTIVEASDRGRDGSNPWLALAQRPPYVLTADGLATARATR